MTDAVLQPWQRRRGLVAVIVCMAVTALSYGLSWPLFSLRLEAMGASEAAIGWNAAAPSIAILVVVPGISWLLSRFGAAWVMIVSILASVAAFLLCPILDDVDTWFVLRFFIGACGHIMWIAGETWINEIAEDKSRGRTMALYGMALGVGSAIGPLVLTGVGFGGWTPFALVALLTVISTVPIFMAVRSMPSVVHHEDTAGGHDHRSPLVTFSHGMRSVVGSLVRAPLPMLLNLCFAMLFAATWTFLPIYGPDVGLDVDTAVLLLTIQSLGGIVLQYPIGWIADRIDRRLLSTFLVAVISGAYLIMPVALGDPFWAKPYVFFLGGMSGAVYSLALTLIGERFRGRDLAGASTMFTVMWNIGAFLGPPISGQAIGTAGLGAFPYVLFVMTVIFLPVCVASYLRRHRADGNPG
jgi:MFS family permease